MRHCVLCNNLTAAGDLILDFGFWKLLLHPDAAVAGHAMLVAGRHVENFADLAESEALQFARVQPPCERALLEATGTQRAILMKLGLQTPHFHVHIYPVIDTMDRAAVMRAIDGQSREERPADLARRIRDVLLRLT